MERITFKLKLLNNKKEEYKRRHDEIWPEMTKVLNEAGIHNYTIALLEDNLFGYYETEDFNRACDVQAKSEVVKKWNVYMQDILDSEEQEDGSIAPKIQYMEKMFYHK